MGVFCVVDAGEEVAVGASSTALTVIVIVAGDDDVVPSFTRNVNESGPE
jgi:hypothetical protein